MGICFLVQATFNEHVGLMKKYIALATITLLAGCVSHVTMTGKAYQKVDPLDVKILFKEKPKCDYEELGFISTPLEWNQNVAVDSAREQAAKIGADYMMIETVNTNAFNDVSVSAVAYKCGSVNREKVTTSP